MPDQPRVHAIHVAKARRLPTRVVASVEAEEGRASSATGTTGRSTGT